MKKGGYSGVRATSAGWDAIYKNGCEASVLKRKYTVGRSSAWSRDCQRRCQMMYDYLKDSPEPVGQYVLCRMGGYNSVSILESMTYYHTDIYEEDDGKIGIVGVHAS